VTLTRNNYHSDRHYTTLQFTVSYTDYCVMRKMHALKDKTTSQRY